MDTSAPPTAADTAISAVAYLAGISDPTDDGMLINIVNWGLAAIMVLAVLVGGWFGFKAWLEAKGKKEGITAIRDITFGVLAIEAFLGGIMFIANYGSSFISNFS